MKGSPYDDVPSFHTAGIRWVTVENADHASCKSLKFVKLSTKAYSESKSLPLGIISTKIHDGYEDYVMIRAKVEYNNGVNWETGNHQVY